MKIVMKKQKIEKTKLKTEKYRISSNKLRASNKRRTFPISDQNKRHALIGAFL